MAEPAKQFSLRVFDDFSKVYATSEDLSVRRMYVNPSRLLFMFDQLNLNILNK